ncbi:hypothetical protein B296_00038054, partial [Ensete ventricosum]
PAKALEAELGRANEENKRLKEMLSAMAASYTTLRSQMTRVVVPETSSCERDDARRSSSEELPKRVKEEERKPKVSKLFVVTDPSDSSLVSSPNSLTSTCELLIADSNRSCLGGQRWVSMAEIWSEELLPPSKCCLLISLVVAVQVQRSAEDASMLVATYEGEHSHGESSRPKAPHASGRKSAPAPPRRPQEAEPPDPQRSLVEQMAVSLTNDPDFRAALTAAISGRMSEPSPPPPPPK